MSGPSPASLKVHLLRLLLGFPFFAVWGVVVLLGWGVGFGRRALGARHALSATFPCPHGHPNPSRGRFRCASCRGVYLGWVGRCGVCGASAGYVECVRCGVTVRLPWRP